MATFKDLLGDNYTEMTEDELNQVIMTGRLAREGESNGARTKVKKAAAEKKPAACKTVVEIDDDEFE